jgi:hypothetical protein
MPTATATWPILFRYSTDPDSGTAHRQAELREPTAKSCVGAHDPPGGETVHAIFDAGDGYAIPWRGGHEIVTKRQYLAVEFGAGLLR